MQIGKPNSILCKIVLPIKFNNFVHMFIEEKCFSSVADLRCHAIAYTHVCIRESFSCFNKRKKKKVMYSYLDDGRNYVNLVIFFVNKISIYQFYSIFKTEKC